MCVPAAKFWQSIGANPGRDYAAGAGAIGVKHNDFGEGETRQPTPHFDCF